MFVFLNDHFAHENEAFIPIGDPGFLYGEGVFTTLRLYQGEAPELEAHLIRLQQQAQALEIPFALSLEKALSIITELVRLNGIQKSDARLRLTVTRGYDPDNHFPLEPSTATPPTVLMTVRKLAPTFDKSHQKGVAVITLGAEHLRLHLPQLKNLNYLPSLLALREAHRRGCTEAMVFDQNGHLTEGAASNIFLVKAGTLFTPLDNGQILAGQTRGRIITMAQQLDLPCEESNLTLDDLHHADEVFLCNSIRQIVPVIAIDEAQVAEGIPGPITLQLSQRYTQIMGKKERPDS